MTGASARLAISLALVVSTALFVGSVSSSHNPGHDTFNDNCATSTCHGTDGNNAYLNGADAASVIDHALAGGMPASAAPAGTGAIAGHIGTILPTPGVKSVPFHEGPGLGPGATHNLEHIYHSVSWGGGATSTAQLQTPSPGKGSVSFGVAGFNYTFTYQPNGCATGTDKFGYNATGAATTSTRAQDITIDPPTSAPTFTTTTLAAGETNVPYSQTVNVRCQVIASFNLFSGTLPPGLTLAGDGTISGTPTSGAVGTHNFTVRAVYAGAASTQALSITIALGKPAITSATTAPHAAVGVAYPGYQVTATNSPTSYSASGLPPGLVLNTGTGAITSPTPATISAAGSPYTASIFATNASGAGNPTNVTFNVAPAINSAATATGSTGNAFNYQITGTAGPAFTSFAALDPLPAGLVLNTTTGAITGTPTTVGGPTNVRLTGTTAVGATSGTFTLAITIGLGAPVITSPLTASGGVAVPFNYQITATNPPHTSYNATGLPTGLNIDTSSGVISGTPTVGGTFNVTITATNATGPGNATLVLSVSNNPPVITSAGTASGSTGTAFTYTIVASNVPISFSTSALPAGLTLNASTGVISGTPTAAGTFNVSMTATNGSGSDTKPLVITIALGPPVITSPLTAGGSEGSPFSYQITATNNPTSFGATGLPPGLALSASTGLISGTPVGQGTFTVQISATNATATANATLSITLGIGIPVIISAPAASGGTSGSFFYQIVATNGPTSFGATGLPPGLSINSANGIISGAPTDPGTFVVNLTATNGTGTGSRVLTLSIVLTPPTIVVPSSVPAINGVPFGYQIQATNAPTGYSATGLPPGLRLDTASGVISGTPTITGTYDVAVAVTNAVGTTTFTLRIIVGMAVPTAAPGNIEVPYETATPITLTISGEQYMVNIVRLPEHGLVTVPAGSNIATYTPADGYVGTDSFRYTVANAAGTSAEATIAINVFPTPPSGTTALFTVQLNTPATFDLAKLVKGSGVTGVSIHSAPAHGTAGVNGMKVNYTPRTDYFGADSFRYVAYGSLGQSTPVVINILVVGRPDPTRDRDVVGLVEAQAQAARRYSGVQIGNIQRRMESLHRTEPVVPAEPEDKPAATQTGKAPATAPAVAAPEQKAEPVRLASASGALPQQSARDVGPPSLVTALAQVVTSGTVSGSTTAPGSYGITLWASGNAWFGRLDGNGDRTGSEFSTDGLTFGLDRRFGDRLAAGLAAGFAREDAQVGTRGTKNKARAGSIAAYGSYQAGPRTYIDFLLGYGTLDFDSRRYVTTLESIASASRKGRQFFGSIAGAYEYRYGNLLVSPYGRLDFSADRLDSVSESGVGNHALTFGEQDQKSSQAVIGLRAESRHETDFGFAQPRARIEYRRELGNASSAQLWYSDLPGEVYSITPTGTSRNALLFGIGTDLVLGGGLKVGLDYLAQRSAGASNNQGVRLMVTQELGAGAAPPWRFEPRLFRYSINTDFSLSYDDNVNRAREAPNRLEDSIFGLSANVSRAWPVVANMRFQATGLVSGEKFRTYNGLGRFSGGAQGELQYRTSGAFDATTFAVVGRALYEQYESEYRTGPRYFVGFNARRALTDRIEIFGELGHNWRYGGSDVFNWKDYAAKLNIDYALGRKGILYLSGEYRRGDSVSSGPPSLAVGAADVFVPDDAFEDQGFIAYRIDGTTLLGTVGINYPLGARDSVDLSWRRVEGKAKKKLSFESAPLKYIDNQYSIMYLMRF